MKVQKLSQITKFLENFLIPNSRKEGDILCSKYRLKSCFDEGGFCKVWLATDIQTQEDFALKIYDNVEDIEEFIKGFRLVVNFTHSNIFRPLSFDIHNGIPFIVMSYCKNGSALPLVGKMNEDQLWNFAHDVAAGLAYLHAKYIVHQDIKPGNVLIDDSGKFMITDFDISTQAKTIKLKSKRTQKFEDFNYGSGTPPYMGPERYPDEEKHYVPPHRPMLASDIWSLGASLYELVEGDVPYGTYGGDAQRHGYVPKDLKGKCSKELRKLIGMCLEENTWKRPSAETIAKYALKHKAPKISNPKPPIPHYIKGVVLFIVLSSIIPIYKINKRIGCQGEIKRKQDSIYFVRVNEANNIIKEKSDDPHRHDNYSRSYVDKLVEACVLYKSTDTLTVSHDSVRIKGKELWAVSQSIIDNEYKFFDEQMKIYNGADYAEKEFRKRRDELKDFVSDKVK